MEWEQLAGQLHAFLFLLVRVSALILSTPLFGSAGVPVLPKVGLSAALAFLLLPLAAEVAVPPDLPGYLLVVAKELLLGLSMGFLITVAFAAFQVAGQFMDVSMGFGMVNVLDPQTGAQVPILGQFYHMLALLIFFTINGHHAMFAALARGLAWAPVGAVMPAGPWVQLALEGFANMFVLAVRIALPVVATDFLTNVALGIVTRAVPQINVFITGFPVKIALGLFVAALGLPIYVSVVGAAFGDGGELARLLLRLFLTR